MKKMTVKFLIAFSALLGSLVLGACSEASIEELDDQVAEAIKNGPPDKIKKYAEKACEKNSVYGCHTLGGFYETMADYRNAALYLEKSCKMGIEPWSARSCGVLGTIYYKGIGVEQDFTLADIYFEKSCNLSLKDGYGCYAIGERLARLKYYEKSIPYFENGCILNAPEACVEIGAIYHDGLGVDVNKAKAFVFLEKACELNDGQGCFMVAGKHMLGINTPADTTKAMQYLKKACDLGFEASCIIYGQYKNP
ncbi:MAG: sel1 repeat family protein [Fibrobacter sp.]|nr:sel1 repeat family protein [Fibrobacter sp.]